MDANGQLVLKKSTFTEGLNKELEKFLFVFQKISYKNRKSAVAGRQQNHY